MGSLSTQIIELFGVQDKMVQQRLVSLELHMNTWTYPIKSKYFLIEAHESEAYLIHSKKFISEFVFVTSENQIGEENLQKLESVGIRLSNQFPSEIGIYYFPSSALYKNYYNQVYDFSIVITKTEGLELGPFTINIKRNNKLCSFIKIRDEALERVDQIIFHYMNEEMSCAYLKCLLGKAKSKLNEVINNEEDFIEPKSIENIMYSLNKEFEQFNTSERTFDISVINDVHLKIILQQKQESIPLFIKILSMVFYKIVEGLRVDTDPESLIAKLSSLKSISYYGLVPMLYDYITKPRLSDLIINSVYEISQNYPMDIVSSCFNRDDVRLLNANTNPQLFQFITQALNFHIDLLLSDTAIRQGFTQLDSFTVSASSEEEASKELNRILQSQPTKEDSGLYEIQQGFENQYHIIPKAETLMMHLKSLIPQEIISIPARCKVRGKTLLGGKIAVKDTYLLFKTPIQQARLILILIHEISHKKLLLIANKNCWLPKTTEQNLNLFIDKLIYGQHASSTLCNLHKVDKDIAGAILSKKHLTQIQAEKIFKVPSINDLTSECKEVISDDDDDDDDSHYVCDRGFYLHQLKRRKRLSGTL